MIRDRMGVKPLYFYPTPGGMLFSSAGSIPGSSTDARVRGLPNWNGSRTASAEM
ncbi:MAG: hypothetical protein WCH82_03285 [Mycobacteriaceae bacterium]